MSIALLGLSAPNFAGAAGYPADLDWRGVAFGNNTFVAVASSGTGTRVMTSTDGQTWSPRQSASDADWHAVTFHNNLFVAVGTNAVMTSADGISWTSVTAPAGSWDSVVGCNGMYVATASTGSPFVMYSTAPTSSWTVATPAHGWDHQQLACNPDGSRFVSSSHLGRVWSSADGIAWTAGSTPIVHIHAKAFAEINGVDTFVWLEYNDYDNNGAMSATSINGSSFTTGAYHNNLVNGWEFMIHANGMFVAVAHSGNNVRATYSTNGVNWTLGNGIPANAWEAVAYGNNTYVAVASSGTGDRVATSPDGITWTALAVDEVLNNVPPQNPAQENPQQGTPGQDSPTVSETATTIATGSESVDAALTGGKTQRQSTASARAETLPRAGSDSGILWSAILTALIGSGALMIRRRLLLSASNKNLSHNS